MRKPEFKASVILRKKQPASVLLTIDLSGILHEIRSGKKGDEKHQFEALRDEITDLTGGLIFEKMVLPKLYEAQQKHKPLSLKKKAALENKISECLAISLLKNSAIEFIKNSVDAFLHHNQSNTRKEADVLGIHFELQVDEAKDTARVTITDNAGGFPDAFLDKMEKKLSIDSLAAARTSNKKDNEHSYGGHGLGIDQFLAGLQGIDLHPDGKIEQKLDFSQNPKTSASFQNSNDILNTVGAQIIVETPLTAIARLSSTSEIIYRLGSKFKPIETPKPSSTHSPDSDAGTTSGRTTAPTDISSEAEEEDDDASIHTIESDWDSEDELSDDENSGAKEEEDEKHTNKKQFNP